MRQAIRYALLCILLGTGTPPLSAAKPIPPATANPRTGTAPDPSAFPPRPLEQQRSVWLKALADGTSGASSGSPERAAWQIGAWWAIVDWCAERGRNCEAGAAEYMRQVMNIDPRSLTDCGWEHAIGGLLGDGYDATSSILYEKTRPPVRLDLLFEKHEVKSCPNPE